MRFDSLLDIVAITLTVWVTWKFANWFWGAWPETVEAAERLAATFGRWLRERRKP